MNKQEIGHAERRLESAMIFDLTIGIQKRKQQERLEKIEQIRDQIFNSIKASSIEENEQRIFVLFKPGYNLKGLSINKDKADELFHLERLLSHIHEVERD